MKELCAIKVRIGRRGDGRAKYPKFAELPCIIKYGLDWSHYVDVQGMGWMYDKTSGHGDDTPESPAGQQWGMLVIPEEFANEAVEAFPDDCFHMTPEECEKFHDECVTAHVPAESIHEQTLVGLHAQLQLINALHADDDQPTAASMKLTAQKSELKKRIVDALDPEHPSVGVRKNRSKKWQDRAARAGVTVKRRPA